MVGNKRLTAFTDPTFQGDRGEGDFSLDGCNLADDRESQVSTDLFLRGLVGRFIVHLPDYAGVDSVDPSYVPI